MGRASWRLVAGFLAMVVLGPSSVARAGNDDGVLLGNEAAMTGGAVAAVVSDGSAVWYNPAGLAAISRDAVDVSGSAVQIRAAEEGGLLSSTTGESNDGGYLELVSIPSAVTLARRLGPGVNVAFGIFAPRFSQNTTRTGLDTVSGEDVARWTLNSAENAATYHAGGGIGFRLGPHLRFGVSLFAVYRDFYTAFQSAGSFQFGDGSNRLSARGGLQQVRTFGAEVGAGLQWEPHPGVLLALTARSPGLEFLTQVRSTTVEIDAVVGGPSEGVSFLPEDREDLAFGFAILTPARVNLAFAHRFDRGFVAAELDVQHPLDFAGVVQRQLVYNVRIGGRYQFDSNFGLGAGFFTDRSAGRPIQELGETRIDFYGVTLGFELRSPHRLAEGENAGTLEFATTAALRYAFGAGEVGGLRFDPNRGTQIDSIVVGTSIHEIGLHIGSALYF